MASMTRTAAAAGQNILRGVSSNPVKLNSKNLPAIQKLAAAQQPTVPSYKRDGLKEGIVHLGIGGFHRSHLAVYIHELLGKGKARDFAIGGVGLQPFDAAMRDALIPQDCLYTLVERAATGSSAHVIGSINSYLFAPSDPVAVINKMAHEDTKIVSMTITESGYFYNENTHQLQVNHPDIVADLGASDLSKPRTTFGYLYGALEQRYNKNQKPFTVLSCDNMQGNGTITGNMLKSFAKLRNPKFAEWIAEHGAFPNSMVDRITPRTTEEDKVSLAETFGVQDDWPVVAEPFKQWVIEDHFSQGRPAFEDVGVQVVANLHQVEQFEAHKLRLLNASHTAMAYLAFLAGFDYVHEVIEHPVFRKFIHGMMHEEVKPLLPQIPGVDLDAYCDKLLERFANPTIMDQITRLTLNGSGKLPQFVMPSVAEQIMAGTHDLKRLSLVVASWFRYLHGVNEQGKPYAIDDARADELSAKAIQGGHEVYPLMDTKDLFGDDLRGDKIFMEELGRALASLHKDGAMKTLENYA